MNNHFPGAALAPLIVLALCLGLASPSQADDGHGHGEAPSGAGQAASPRVEAHSDLFELVGVVDKGQMTVYLDRFGTNEPVAGAKIEFESGAVKGVAQAQPDGTYLAKLETPLKHGDHPFSFTVTAGSDTDLLAGDLRIEDEHPHEEAAARPWARWAAFAAGAAAIAAALLFAFKRRARRAA